MPHLDFTQPPFDVLSADERLSVKKHTQVRYLAQNERLSGEDLTYFYVVLKGQIEQRLGGELVATYLGSNHTEQLNSSDWFDSRRTPDLSAETPEQPEHYEFCALEDSLLLQITGAGVDKIGAQNHLVRQLLSNTLSERLKSLNVRRNTSNAGATSYTAQQEVQQILLQPVTDITLLPVHIIEAHSSLYQAARIMNDASLKHVLVRPPTPTESVDTASSLMVKDQSSDRTLGMLSDNDIAAPSVIKETLPLPLV